MSRTITFSIETTADQRNEWKAIRDARADLDKREKALTEGVKSHPQITVAKKLVSYTSPEVNVTMRHDGHGFNVSFVAREALVSDAPKASPQKPQPPRVYLDPKTLNLLLNSKMLTDEQKVALLCRMDAGLEDILNPEKGGAA